MACFGFGELGNLGVGSTVDLGDSAGEMANLQPLTLPSSTSRADHVATSLGGGDHTCVVFVGGQAVCFGSNSFGECNTGSRAGPVLGPLTSLVPFGPVKQVVALQSATCALSADDTASVTCWGAGAMGTLGRGSAADVYSMSAAGPVVFDPAETAPVTAISGLFQHVCALFSNGRVKCWGQNASGQLGQPHTREVGLAASDMTSLPFIAFSDTGAQAAQVSAGRAHTCVRFSSPAGRIICFGRGVEGQLGSGLSFNLGPSQPYITFSSSDAAVDLSAGGSHTCAVFDRALSAGGAGIRCWGSGHEGQLGTNDRQQIGDNPTEMSTLNFISFSDAAAPASVSAGFNHTCAVFAGDATRCWGSGSHGALGQDSTANVGDVSEDMVSLRDILLLPSILRAVTPSSGSIAGSETIVITGAYFPTPTVTVHFFNSTVGGCPTAPVSLTGVAPVDLTTVVIQTPSWGMWCGPGAANLVVTAQSPAFNLTTLPWPFLFFAPGFAVTSFSPASPMGGPCTGGTLVTLVGTGLVSTPDALCKIGLSTSALTVINSTTGTCTSTGVKRALNVTVAISLNGRNFTTAGPTFNYYDVTGLALDMSRGPATGGTPIAVRISSTGAVAHPGNAAAVKFTSQSNGSLALAVRGTVVSDPAASSGFSVATITPDTAPFALPSPAAFTLTVSLNGGLQFLPPVSSAFEYYSAPAVSGLALAGIPADNAAGVVLTILGTSFRDYPQSFCRITLATGARVVLPTTFDTLSSMLRVTLSAFSGASIAGPAVFEVSLNDGRQYTSNGKSLTLFVVSGVAPAGGPLAGGTALTVAGAGFTPTSILCKVGVGGSPSLANFVSSTAITCSSPPGLAVGAAAVMASIDAARFSSPAAAQFIFYERSIFERLDPALGSSNTTASSVMTVVGRSFPVLAGVQVKCRFGTVDRVANSSSNGTVVCPLPSGSRRSPCAAPSRSPRSSSSSSASSSSSPRSSTTCGRSGTCSRPRSRTSSRGCSARWPALRVS
jgi:alpha-tubulin suppressor-like RCC1 family protein